ncbi:MAG: adenylyltransferase/cytidyltransferase family protein [Candidatus Paceibacterota bacterium]
MERQGILSSDCSPGERFISDYKALKDTVEAIRALGGRVVLTSGSFDLAHIGHARYLREARLRGDFLIVGVESDERVRARKGDNRPIVPEAERVESLTHLRYVDVVTIKGAKDQKWKLIKCVRPDVLVISERTGYSNEKVVALGEFCGEVVNLESQAETSTSARLREMQIEVLGPAIDIMRTAIHSFQDGLEKLEKMNGG